MKIRANHWVISEFLQQDLARISTDYIYNSPKLPSPWLVLVDICSKRWSS
jgi:hypothetical protein